jgi:hypothetical protein
VSQLALASRPAPAAVRSRIEVRRFRPDDIPGIRAFNSRLAAAGLSHRLGSEDRQPEEPSLETDPIIERLYVAAEGENIRGGVWLKEQLFWAHGCPVRVGWAKYPLVESLINAAAAGVPATLLFSLLRQQPRLMALGMGGHGGQFAKLLAAARWANSSVPFFFRLLRPSRVLRQLSPVRTSRVRRIVADGLAYSGLAWSANQLLVRAHGVAQRRTRDYSSSLMDRFDAWADDLWERCRDSYGFLAVRDSRALNSLYPLDFKSLARLRVQRRGRDVGWICARSIQTAGTWFERTFGSVKLGIITDGLAQPADAAAVMQAGVDHLVGDDVDLIVTFQLHPSWCAAALNGGLIRGPSNCAFYRAPAVEDVIARAAVNARHCHLTCSDGDGPEQV